MAIEGTLDLFQLPEILQLVSHQGKTGILTIQGESDIVAISFERGRVVAADALNQTLEEALGEVLAGQGLVGPSDFAAVSAAHRAGQGRLMDLLVERRLVSRPQLLSALRLHTYRLLLELLAWRAGEFKFYTGEEVAYEEGFQPIAVEELLIRSVEEAAGEGHPTIPDSRSIYEPVVSVTPVRVRHDGGGPSEPAVGAIWITEPDKQVLDALAGGYSVAALVRKVGLDEYKARYTLHRLLELGLVRRRPAGAVVAEVPPPAPPSPAAGGAAEAPEGAEIPPSAGLSSRASRSPLSRAVADRLGWALAALLAVLAVVGLWRSPLALTLPFPWDRSHRQALERDLAMSAFLKIDRATKAYFLLHDRFPDQLEALANTGVLANRDLWDPLGRFLDYRPQETSYSVVPREDDRLEGEGRFEAVSGNFLLDADFLSLPQSAKTPPLVLLD